MKRVAVINDLSCYGRCSLTVQLPILSAMNYETCPLPSALYSAHGAFRGHFSMSMKQQLIGILQHWNKLSLCFDGILCGFLPELEQFSALHSYFSNQKQQGCNILLDPVMGDNGTLYSITTPEICEGYRALLPITDFIVPNLTECCALLEIPYPSIPPTVEKLFSYAEKLCRLGTKAVVITGVPSYDENGTLQLQNLCYQKNGQKELISVKRVGSDRSGTGDVFSALLFGYLLRGISLSTAVRRSCHFLSDAIFYTTALNTPSKNGVCFETFLSELSY